MIAEMVVRLLRGRLPGFGGTRDPHVFAYTLRSLRSGVPRQTPARDASRPFPWLLRGHLPGFGGTRDPHVFAYTLRSLRSGVPRQTPARDASRPFPWLLRGRLPGFGGARDRRGSAIAPRLLGALLVGLILAGCGFQLRGQSSLPPEMAETLVRFPDETTEFARELRLLLRANDVRLADAPGEGVAELRILQDRISRRALTISADARVREFVLVFDLRFSLTDAEGNALLTNESLRLERDFQFDEQEILGAATEEEMLRDDLRRAMARALIRRLEAFGRG